VLLRGISPLIWRRQLLRSNSTVAQLHQALQVAFGWEDEHLNRFEIRGREYAVYRDGGGMMGIDARSVRLDGLKLRRLERFVHEYDFGDSWIHDLSLEATLPTNPRKILPDVCRRKALGAAGGLRRTGRIHGEPAVLRQIWSWAI
jgi:hypothetical protein